MDYYDYLGFIEDNIDDLVIVQDNVAAEYTHLNRDNLDKIGVIRQGLQDEQDILRGLINNLNNLFNITPSWRSQGFRITPMDLNRYKIKHPHIDKSSIEYVLLKKVLINSHKKHFLHDGLIRYAYSNVEGHMWEIPNRIPNDYFIRNLRKQLK